MIRHCKPEDVKTLRYICHSTAKSKKHRESLKLVSLIYCDYYVENEISNCFVLTDEFDRPVGYVLCSSDYEQYKKGFEPYLKEIKKLYLKDYIIQKLLQKEVSEIAADYPAHLYSFILPSFRHKGKGRALLNTVIGQLRAQNVKGLHIVVPQTNKDSIAFYERLGFERIKRLSKYGYIYAIKLDQ